MKKAFAARVLVGFLFAAASAATSHGAEIVPFYTFNQSPLIQIHGLPAMDNARVVPRGRTAVILSVDAANNYAVDSNPTERITLDGETYRFVAAGRYGVARGVEIGLDIPYVVHSGGFLDGFIEGFHNFFGLPNGGRENAPRDRLLYQYSVNGSDRINFTDSSHGIGDVRLSGALQLHDSDNAAVTLRAMLKLPTGNANRLQGSGGVDFSMWFTASEDWKLPSLGHLTGFGGFGGMVMGDGDILPSQQRTVAAFGSLGLGWSPIEWLALKVQANGHTSLYEGSSVREVNRGSIQLVSGGAVAFSKYTSLDIGVSEDVIVETSPDVVFTLTLRTLF